MFGRKKIISAILILMAVAVAVAGFYLWRSGFFHQETATEKSNLIRVDNIKPDDIITSPLVITGEARGNWYFEASFPIFLTDWDGRIIAQGNANAQGSWMTADFVPFSGTLEFERPAYGERGFLILKKDNPSGLPQNADEFKVPVVFGTASVETMAIKVFFNNNKMDPEISCNKVFPVERIIAKTAAVANAALEQLFNGPTEQEKTSGFFTSINSGVKIQKLTIENGVAKVDFNDQLEFQVGGSCRVSAIRAQITQTLKQFLSVSGAIISINNRTEDILQP